MTLLHWRPSMSVGVADVDAEHKALIDRLNKLHYMVVAGDEPAEIQALLDDLVTTTRDHFRREETLIRASSYPAADRHCELHSDLLAQLEAYRGQYREDPAAFDDDGFYDFLTDWLLVHVVEEDAKLAPYVATKPAKLAS